MHEGEIFIDEDQVRRLIDSQFPLWASEPISRVAQTGTDHSLFRIGDLLLARMPRIEWAVGQVETDAKWLPYLAEHLPLRIPCPVAVGQPGEGFPWPWTVVPWIPGVSASANNVDPLEAAISLGEFVLALRQIDPVGAPVKTGTRRGCPLVARDKITRLAIEELGDRIDGERVGSAWEKALQAQPWDGPVAWLHGDLEPGNILADQGKITAIIDFGEPGLGDPAVDLLPAWSLFEGPSRETFRKSSGCDDDMWERGKGWALTTALIALPYYWDKSPGMVSAAQSKIDRVLKA